MAQKLDERFAYARWTGRSVSKLGARGAGATPADSYFAVIPGFSDMHLLAAEAHLTARALRSSPVPTLKATASVVEAQIQSLGLQIKEAELMLAKEADKRIRQKIRDSARRPPTTGRLERAIQSRPLFSRLFPALSVGIADLSKLDSPSGRLRYYWRTQEFGSDHIVGLRVPGFFQPGGAFPDQAAFRQHPYFKHVPGERESIMEVRRPIEERAFLREAAWEIGQLAGAEAQRIRTKALRDLARVQGVVRAAEAYAAPVGRRR